MLRLSTSMVPYISISLYRLSTVHFLAVPPLIKTFQIQQRTEPLCAKEALVANFVDQCGFSKANKVELFSLYR